MAGKVIMKPDLLGAGCYEYSDEDEPVVVCRTAANAEVRDGMEKNVYSLEELAPEMDAVAAESEEGLEQEKVVPALQVKVEEQGPQQEDLKEAALMLQVEKAEEQGPEQETLKEAALTLQVEKVEDHLRALEYIAFAVSKNTYESDSFGVASVASIPHATK
jgi:hypothetical protein